MADTATFSAKSQISIPKTVREAQQWRAGQEFVFIAKGKGVRVLPLPKPEQFGGLAKRGNPERYRDRSDRV